MCQVRLVANEDYRHLLGALNPDYLVAHRPDVHERLEAGNAVDDEKSLAVLYVEIPHGGELLCPCRIQDLEHRRLPIDLRHARQYP